jgi:transcriptional regulator with XRE-family HTH domain
VTAAPQLLATVQRDEIVNMIGPKIATLRKAQGLSLQQLATNSDVSAAAIHKIERSGMVPTVTTLLKIAGALGVPVGYFVDEEGPQQESVHFTKAGTGRAVYTPHEGLALTGISGSYRQFQAAAAVATMAPGADSGARMLRHPGEELVFVLRGKVRFTIGEQEFAMGPGDSLHFNGDVPHHWCNSSRRDAELLWVALRNG